MEKDTLDSFLNKIANGISRLRRIEKICQTNLDLIPSTQDEINGDWYNACTYLSSVIIDGTMPFTEIDSESYPILEEIWLDDIKRFKAFCLWENTKQTDVNKNYFDVCINIRNLLLNKDSSPLAGFTNTVKSYILKNYLYNGKIDAEKSDGANRLIAKKADRISRVTRNNNSNENWFRAQLYVKLYYENIIPAIEKGNEDCMKNVLRAFEFIKSPENSYLIINSLEAIIPIYFFDKKKLNELIDNPTLFDFNLVPIQNWPQHIDISRITNGRLNFLSDAHQLVYDGVMDEKEKTALMTILKDDKYTWAIDKIFNQSHQEPLRDMVL